METAENPMQKIIARCWEDEEFKKRLMADPAKILGAEGVSVPDGVSIRVVEDTDQVRTLIIPPEPSQQPLRLFLQLSFRPYFHNIDNEYNKK